MPLRNTTAVHESRTVSHPQTSMLESSTNSFYTGSHPAKYTRPLVSSGSTSSRFTLPLISEPLAVTSCIRSKPPVDRTSSHGQPLSSALSFHSYSFLTPGSSLPADGGPLAPIVTRNAYRSTSYNLNVYQSLSFDILHLYNFRFDLHLL